MAHTSIIALATFENSQLASEGWLIPALADPWKYAKDRQRLRRSQTGGRQTSKEQIVKRFGMVLREPAPVSACPA